MIYKFDILFKKTLFDGGVKMVTYHSLLENPKVFGDNENLAGVIGKLSLVREGTEKDFSLNSLLREYYSLLIGGHLAEIFRKDFPLQFMFNDANDVTSIRSQISDEEANIYSYKVELREIDGEEILDLRDDDSPVMFIPENGDIELNDEIGSIVKLKQGEVGFVIASTNQIMIKAEKVKTLCLKIADEKENADRRSRVLTSEVKDRAFRAF